MKILTEEESQGISLLRQGRNSLLRKMLLQLQTGQMLELGPQDWTSTNPHYHVARRIAKQTGRTFEYGQNPTGKGWLFKRVK